MMESPTQITLSDRVADEFDRAELEYNRVAPDLFEVPTPTGNLAVRLAVGESRLRLVVPSLFRARSSEEFKAVCHLNYKFLTFGRLGGDVSDGEVRFEAEVPASDVASIAAACVGAWALSDFAAEVLNRVRFGGASPQAALEATVAEFERRRALSEVDEVANQAWESQS